MTANRQELERQIDRLREECAQHEENHAKVGDLLKKADERWRKELKARAKWNRVIRNLETCLREANGGRASCEAEMARLRKRLEGLPLEKPTTGEAPPDLAEFEDIKDLPTLTAGSLDVAKKILGMPLEDIGKLSLEEVAGLHDEIEGGGPETAGANMARLMGRLELANQTAEEGPAWDAGDVERRRQYILRSAIDKISMNRIDHMTEKEIRLILATYTLLTRRLSSSPRDERLRRILGAAVKVLRRRLDSQ